MNCRLKKKSYADTSMRCLTREKWSSLMSFFILCA